MVESELALLAELKPRMRGWIHLYAGFAAILTGVVLVTVAWALVGPMAALACGIYALTVCGVFGVSATYHRVDWTSDVARTWMKRADHSMIFVFIAGSYTPFCVMGLEPPEQVIVLASSGPERWPGSPSKCSGPGPPAGSEFPSTFFSGGRSWR